MALRMVALIKAKDGRWLARKGVPKDVRDDYARLYGISREAQLKLPGDTPRYEAKVRLGEWEAEVETRIATLRAKRNGEGQPLTQLNALALAGRWYTWFVRQHEADPGKAKRWRDLGENIVWDVLYPHAPDSYLADEKSDPHWDWVKEPEARAAVRPLIAEEARVARFLANEGITLNDDAHALLVDAVADKPAAAMRSSCATRRFRMSTASRPAWSGSNPSSVRVAGHISGPNPRSCRWPREDRSASGQATCENRTNPGNPNSVGR
jgi:hypothetical protein